MNTEKKFRKKRWHQPFFDALSRFGTITAACLTANIGRATYYRATEHPEFMELVEQAIGRHRDAILLRLTTMAMGGSKADPVPKNLSLQALMFLANRADRLGGRGTAGPVNNELLPDDDTITITVTEEVAKQLLQPRPALLPPFSNGGNGNGHN